MLLCKKIPTMIERFLKQASFSSMQDFRENFELRIPENFNFAYDIVDAWAEEQPNKLAMLWTNDCGQERRYTFADMKCESDRAASYFLSLGIGKGDRVMLILKRRVEFWITILALHKIGAIAIPATFLLRTKDIVYRCVSASVKAIVAVGEPELLGYINEAMMECPTVRHCISVGDVVPGGWRDYQKEVRMANPFVRPKHVNNTEDLSILYFTSGTSGEPKMVVHDYSYALAHLSTAAFWHNLTPESLHLTVADSGWAKAVWGKLYGQWIVGAALFVYDHDKFEPTAILSMIEKYKITSFCAPPTVYRFMVHEDLDKYDLSSLKYCTTAGEALNASVFETFYKHTGLRLMEGFGQTETTLTLGTFPWMDSKPGSMGVPNPQYDMVLLDQNDEPITKPGEVGQIAVRIDKRKQYGLFVEYYRNPVYTRSVCHGGYYYTRDLAYFDEDGYYWFVGRDDDMIKSSGYRIGPFEVESALMTHPAVVECAITGVPDEIRGMVVKATVILKKEWRDKAGDALVKELQNHVKNETAPYKYPRIVEFVDELPKTISGKIRRVEIRENDHEKNF